MHGRKPIILHYRSIESQRIFLLMNDLDLRFSYERAVAAVPTNIVCGGLPKG